MRTLAIALSLLLALTSPATADLIITEVYYDHAGMDADFEWVEIFNTGPGPVDLTGYTLGNGGTSYDFSTVPLQGTIASCETFVIGSASTVDNGAPTIDQVFDFDPDFQNSGSTADGVVLFGPGADPGIDCPLDAVIYGAAGSNANGLRDQSCGVGDVDVGDAGSGSSIERTSLAGDWIVQASPDPNGISFTISCDPVDGTAESWGTLKVDYRD